MKLDLFCVRPFPEIKPLGIAVVVLFASQVPFLLPRQQCRCTEGWNELISCWNFSDNCWVDSLLVVSSWWHELRASSHINAGRHGGHASQLTVKQSLHTIQWVYFSIFFSNVIMIWAKHEVTQIKMWRRQASNFAFEWFLKVYFSDNLNLKYPGWVKQKPAVCVGSLTLLFGCQEWRVVYRVRTDPGKSRKVMEFKIQIFQAWKVVELGLGPGKSWKINQMVAAFLTRVHVFSLYIHHHPLSDYSICCLVDLIHVYENLISPMSTRLNTINSSGKTWKMDINGPGKSWKMHIKRSWKVAESHFQCSVRTLRVLILVLWEYFSLGPSAYSGGC